MKKITFYKTMIDRKQKRNYFEQAKGYLFECSNGVQVAIEKTYFGGWKSTEITSGFAVTDYCDTRKEAIEKICAAAPTLRKRLDGPDAYLAEAIKALKTYTEQQQRITV